MKHFKVLFGITGGIAAVKIAPLISDLCKESISVYPVMTKSACKIVDPRVIEKSSGNSVFIDLFERNFSTQKVLKTRTVDHITLADQADLAVVAPATANILGKLAHGIADDLLTTTLLAVSCPILVFPSMNVHMWRHPVVQGNVKILQQSGYFIFPPESGPLACGYEGDGRLPVVSFIKERILTHLQVSKRLKGKKVVVTAGGTSESIDSIRRITNRSSGKMGACIADECFLLGAEVILLRAVDAVCPRYVLTEETFETADELSLILKKHVKTADIVIHTAAVSDFHVKAHKGKLSSDKKTTLTLEPREKIVDSIKNHNKQVFLVAFKAEYGVTTEELIERSRKKMHESGADMVVANDVSKKDSGFGSEFNEVIVVLEKATKKIPRSLKRDIAAQIMQMVCDKIKL